MTTGDLGSYIRICFFCSFDTTIAGWGLTPGLGVWSSPAKKRWENISRWTPEAQLFGETPIGPSIRLHLSNPSTSSCVKG